MLPRLTLPLAASALLVALAGGPAAAATPAHVFFDADKRVPGATDVNVVLLVQSENHGGAIPVATDKVVLHLPTANAFVGVTAAAPAGWQVAQTATTITWSGGSIPPSTSLLFPMTVAQLPSSTEVAATVDQGYADGVTVIWSDMPRAAGPTPIPGQTADLTRGLAHPQALLVLDGVTSGAGQLVATTLATPQVKNLGARKGSSGGTVAGVLVVVVLVAAGGGVFLARRKPVV